MRKARMLVFIAFIATLGLCARAEDTEVQKALAAIFDDGRSVATAVTNASGEVVAHQVVLGTDYGPLALPKDLGAITIDLNGWTICGTNGVVGTETSAGGNGGPAITVAGEAGVAAGATEIAVTNAAAWGEYMVIDLTTSPNFSVSYATVDSFAAFEREYTNDAYKAERILLRKVKKGAYDIGHSTGEADYGEGPRRVTAMNNYWIGVYEVTTAQYARVMGLSPTADTRAMLGLSYNTIRGLSDGSYKVPEEDVTAASFMGVLAVKAGLGNGVFDLPTEAQWEIAARAGSTDEFGAYLDAGGNPVKGSSSNLGEFAWHQGNSHVDGERCVHAVGERRPNLWGLYDTIGNVDEWCRDAWKQVFSGNENAYANAEGYITVSGDGGAADMRLMRGSEASSIGTVVSCHPSYRNDFKADAESGFFGFRLCCTAAGPSSEDNRPGSGAVAALVGGNGGAGSPFGKGSPAIVDESGAEMTVGDPLGLVVNGIDGEDLTLGTEAHPWKIGEDPADSVTAYTNGNVVIVSGSGEPKSFTEDDPAPWGAAVVKIVVPDGTGSRFRAKWPQFAAIIDDGTVEVEYYTWNEAKKAVDGPYVTNAFPVTAETIVFEKGKAYAVQGDITTGEMASITVGGTEDEPTLLILCDGAKLTTFGVFVNDENALVICGQREDTGKLVSDATGTGGSPGIGGDSLSAFFSCGSVTINGGVIEAIGDAQAAGIGGGWMIDGGAITINGGTVTAMGGADGGECAAGIGMGLDAFDPGTIRFAESAEVQVWAGDAAPGTNVTAAAYLADPRAPYVHIEALYPTITSLTALQRWPWNGMVDFGFGLDLTRLDFSANDYTAVLSFLARTNGVPVAETRSFDLRDLVRDVSAEAASCTVPVDGRTLFDDAFVGTNADLRAELRILSRSDVETWATAAALIDQAVFREIAGTGAKSVGFRLDLRPTMALTGACVVSNVTYSGNGWDPTVNTKFTKVGYTNLAYGLSGALTGLMTGSSVTNVALPKYSGEYRLTHQTGGFTSFVTFAVDGLTNRTVVLPSSIKEYHYVVSNMTTGAKVEASSTFVGGTGYELPLGDRIAIWCVPNAGYEEKPIVGANPYVIERVTPATTVDSANLPKVLLKECTIVVHDGGKLLGESDPVSLATNFTVKVVGEGVSVDDFKGYCVREPGEARGSYAINFRFTRTPRGFDGPVSVIPGVFTIAASPAVEAILKAWDESDAALAAGEVALHVWCDPAMGKVKGEKTYAVRPGKTKKASVNATPAKGYVFAGWYLDPGFSQPARFDKQKDYRNASQSLTLTGTPSSIRLFARFVAKTTAADPITWLRYAGAGYCGADASWLAEEETWYQGVQLPTNGCAVAFGSLSLPTVTVSGLPSGVKFDKQALRFTGVPTACSTEKKPFFTVKVTVKNKSGANDVLVKNVRVEPLPAWTVGTFDGYHMEGGATNGTFAATVGKTGKVSGKTKGGWADTTFSAKNFSEVKLSKDGALIYVVDVDVKYKDPVTRKTVTETDTLYLMENPETGLGTIGGGDEDGCGAVAVQRAWDRKDLDFPAFATGKSAPFVELDNGLTLKFGAKGKVTVGGTVYGIKASGTTYVLPFAWRSTMTGSLFAQVPVYVAPTRNATGHCAVYGVRLTVGVDGKFDDASVVPPTSVPDIIIEYR